MNDLKYFDHLRKTCFNDEVGHAFFCYLYEIDTTKFQSMDMPVTSAKKDLCAELLQPIEKFLKFGFLLRGMSINMKVKKHLKILHIHQYRSFRNK